MNKYLDQAGLAYFYDKLPYLTESQINTLITTALSGIYEGFGLSDYGSSPFGQSY
jgi:hypothetical protein